MPKLHIVTGPRLSRVTSPRCGETTCNLFLGAEVARARGEPDPHNQDPLPCGSGGALGGGPSPPGQAEVWQEVEGLLLSHCLPIPASVPCTQTLVSQLIQENKDLIQMGPPLLGARECISVWDALVADQTILKVICQEVRH